MSSPDEYSESNPVIQEHHTWVNETSMPGLVDPTSDETHLFLPEKALQARFDVSSGRNACLTGLLRVVFPHRRPPIAIEDIAPAYSKVFCILLAIGFASYIEHFVSHDSLRDQCLPFTGKNPPHGFPTCAKDDQFWAKFCAAQWRFCVPKLEGKSKKTFDKDCILPIISCRPLGSGGSAVINLIKLHPDYNCLCRSGGEEVSAVHPHTNTFALKSYRGEDARTAFDAEGAAFLKLGKKTAGGIIGYHGSYVQGDKFHVLLDYADQGTLEHFFKNHHPPTDEQDIVLFWEAIFKLIEGLSRIHNDGGQAPSDVVPIQGWHQDVKPANVLVSSLSGHRTSPYTYEFMLADLGLTHFKKKTLTTLAEGTLAPDSRGTKTYGAPECHGFDYLQNQITFSVNSKVDVWSLGCILSEAAVWVVFSYEGLLEYREQRRAETSRVPGFEYGECFHDGENLLGTVQRWHATITKELRKSDVVTSEILRLIEFMMEADPDTRATSKQVLKQSHKYIEEAYLKLSSSGSQKKLKTPSTISSESRYSEADKEGTLANQYPTSSPTQLPYFEGRQVHSPDQMSELSSRNGSFMHATPTRQQSRRANSRRSQVQSANVQNLVSGVGNLGMSRSQNERHETFRSIPEVRRKDTNAYVLNGDVVRHHQDANQSSRPGQMQANRVVSTPPPIRTRISTSNQYRSSSHMHSFSEPNTPSVGSHSNRQTERNPLVDMQYSSASSKHPLPKSRERQQPHTRQVSKLPLSVAMKWRDDKKKGKTYKLPDDWLLDRLNKRDHVFIVDDSASMSKHWKELESLFSILAYIVKSSDPDGLDLHFTMSDGAIHSKRSSKLVECIQERERQGTSEIKWRLDAILSEYTSKLKTQQSLRSGGSSFARRKNVRPLNIYVLTDGVWQSTTDAKPTIINLVETLAEVKLDEKQVGIQFIRFGDDPVGIERLDELDDLYETLGLSLDIVDHTPSGGNNIWKMLLGAIDKDFDAA